MRKALLIKILLRSPIKTLLTFILLLTISFGLFSRVYEYVVTAREFRRIEATFQGVGTVEISPPDRYGVNWAAFLTGTHYNPDSPDGTWENTRYEPLTLEIMAEIAALPYITSTDTRFMTAGIHDVFFRMDDRSTYFNYTHRVVMEATLVSWTTETFDVWDDAARPYGNRVVNARFTDFVPLSDVPDIGLSVLQSRGTWDFPFPSNFRGDFPDWMESSDIERITFRWNVIWNAASNSLRGSHNNSATSVAHDVVDNFTAGARYVIVARFDPVDSMLNMGCSTAEFWLDSSVVPIPEDNPDYLQADEFADIRRLIEITNADLRTFDVVYTNDMASISRFANGLSGIAEGRMITPDDYGLCVAVISSVLAETYGLAIGDTFTLGLTDRLHNQHVGLGVVSAGALGRFARPVKYADLEIVGIYTEFTNDIHQGNNAHWSYSSNTVFVPISLLPVNPEDIEGHRIEPSEFSFVIGNIRDVRSFRETYAPFIENEMGLRLTLTDSGWGEIERDFLLTERIALIAITALVLTMIAAVALVVFLFIVQRKKEYAIMRATGCGKYHANMSVFLPLFAIGIVAIAFGGLGAWFYTVRTMADTQIDVSIPIYVVVVSIFAMLALLAAAEWIGLGIIGSIPPLALLQGGQVKRRKKPKAVAAASSETANMREFKLSHIAPVPAKKGYGAFAQSMGYISRNIRRNKMKSALMILVSAALFASLGQFIASWQATRVLYETLPVTVTFFDRLTPGRASAIEGTGLVKNPYFEFFGGRGELDLHPAVFRVGGGVSHEVQFAVTNDFSRFFDEPVYIEFASGYDLETVLTSPNPVAILFGAAMDWYRLDISLGDNIELTRVAMLSDHTRVYRVVGRASLREGRDEPKSMVFLPPGMSHQELFFPGGTSQNPTVFYDLAEFTVADNHRIDELRSRIEAIGVERNHYHMDTYVLDRVGNNLQIFAMLFPILVAVLGIIGGLLPGLMILQSAKEVALLRVIGTTKMRTRFMVAGQQLLLCVTGLLLGACVVLALNGTQRIAETINLFVLCAAIFVLCYVLGAVICVIKVTRPKVLELLQVRE